MQQLANKWDAELYDAKHAFVFDYGDALLHLLDAKPNERILDLGCGSGVLTDKIARTAREVVGMDLSPEMVKKARERFPSVTFKEGHAADFEFERPFDAIFSNATLHWVTNYKAAAACMFKNLRKGGRIVVEFGGKHNVAAVTNALCKALQTRGYAQQAALQPWYFPTIGEYTTVLEQVGFQVTFAQWYDRPTELSDAEQGIFDWLTMFAKPFFTDVTTGHEEEIKWEVQKKLTAKLKRQGRWWADYKRIRIIANT